MEHAALEILVLLLVGSLVGMVARRLHTPYTLALVLAGIALGFVDLEQLQAFELSADLLFTFLLPALLFEAAFHVDVRTIRRDLGGILLLAGPGVGIAVTATAFLALALVGMTGLRPELGLPQAFLFAAIIAATDPISVVALFKELGVSRRLHLMVEGESLLNDGVAVVAFLVVAAVVGVEVGHGHAPHLEGTTDAIVYGLRTFGWMVGGGVVIGLAIGGLGAVLWRQIDDHLVEITLTTVVAYGSFLLAEQIGASGVLSTVIAGVTTGSFGARFGMSTRTRLAVEDFWEYMAFAANTFVFLLLGLELQIAHFAADALPILIAFGITVVARAAAVGATAPLARLFGDAIPTSWGPVLIWGGLRGSLSMVLVLGLPADFEGRTLLIHLVFGVVSASLFMQGLTMKPLLSWLGLVGGGMRNPEVELQRARLLSTAHARRELEELVADHVIDPQSAARLHAWYEARESSAGEALGAALKTGEEVRDALTYDGLLRLLDVEREALREAVRHEVLTAAASEDALRELDQHVSTVRHAAALGHVAEGLDEVLGRQDS